MKIRPPSTLREVAEFLGRRFVGDPEHEVSGINEIHSVEPGDLVYVDHPKYIEAALRSAASTVMLREEAPPPDGKALIVSADPFGDFNRLSRHYAPFQPATKAVSDSYEVGADTVIQPRVTIGEDVRIGDRCVIQVGVVLHDHTWIGDDVIISANTVIGSDAFYFNQREDGLERMHSCGRVVLEDRVEIGATCTIDRGVTADTRIGEGTKIDNMVHVGHDTVIGKNCLIAAQVGISGCVKIEDGVTLWGQSGVASKVHIGAGAVVLGGSAVTKSIAGGRSYFGSPIDEATTRFRELAALRRLPDFIGRRSGAARKSVKPTPKQAERERSQGSS